jgi:hypothetical protein
MQEVVPFYVKFGAKGTSKREQVEMGCKGTTFF